MFDWSDECVSLAAYVATRTLSYSITMCIHPQYQLVLHHLFHSITNCCCLRAPSGVKTALPPHVLEQDRFASARLGARPLCFRCAPEQDRFASARLEASPLCFRCALEQDRFASVALLLFPLSHYYPLPSLFCASNSFYLLHSCCLLGVAVS